MNKTGVTTPSDLATYISLIAKQAVDIAIEDQKTKEPEKNLPEKTFSWLYLQTIFLLAFFAIAFLRSLDNDAKLQEFILKLKEILPIEEKSFFNLLNATTTLYSKCNPVVTAELYKNPEGETFFADPDNTIYYKFGENLAFDSGLKRTDYAVIHLMKFTGFYFDKTMEACEELKK